jgi:hypothetical protein
MDTSEKYIKMCEKAQEIQETRKIKMSKKFKIIDFTDIIIDKVWLPRQDQLQEMVEGNIAEKFHKFCQFVYPPIIPSEESVVEFINVFTNTFSSFEQLWLAFIMKDKHNKFWNSEKEEWQLK